MSKKVIEHFSIYFSYWKYHQTIHYYSI